MLTLAINSSSVEVNQPHWNSTTSCKYNVGYHYPNPGFTSHYLTRVEAYLAKKYNRKLIQSDLRYTGHYYNERSGLNLAPYRAYDAELGRWLSRDPIAENGGLNLYGYVGNNPVNLWDPLGLFQWEFDIFTPIGGVQISGGRNSGQKNFGIFIGPGSGGGIGFSYDPTNYGCTEIGLHGDVGAVIGGGLGSHFTANFKISDDPNALGLTVTADTPIEGLGISSNYGLDGLSFSPSIGTGIGAGGFIGGGGHYVW